jgi:hypothetical protein
MRPPDSLTDRAEISLAADWASSSHGETSAAIAAHDVAPMRLAAVKIGNK